MRKAQTIARLVVLSVCLFWAVPARADVVSDWNAQILLYSNIGNATLVPPIPVGRPGPPGLLDIALAHLAIHDAVQAIERDFRPYFYSARSKFGVGSSAAAVAAAAHKMLVLLYPGQQSRLDTFYADYLAANLIDPLDPGIAVGEAAAVALHTNHYRPNDIPFVPFIGEVAIGKWRTPPTQPMAFQILTVTEPFTLKRASQFRPEPPPPLRSMKYAREFAEVKALGNAAAHPNATTDQARFWSVNFVAQWNETMRQLAGKKQLSIGDSARMFALANLSAADAAIAVWEAKLFYNFWRPSTAIHEGDDDHNRRTQGDVTWAALFGPDPLYPDYVSGANGLTGAFTGTLRLLFGDHESFSVKSSSPLTDTPERFYTSFSQAAQEVVDARILLGIHFRSADEEARQLGNRVARWVFHKYLEPRRGRW
jgi:hypothetical protein